MVDCFPVCCVQGLINMGTACNSLVHDIIQERVCIQCTYVGWSGVYTHYSVYSVTVLGCVVVLECIVMFEPYVNN